MRAQARDIRPATRYLMPNPAQPRLISTWLCLWMLVSCGGADPAERAEHALVLGRLDRAEALLGTAVGPLAKDVRARLRQARTDRAQLLSTLEGLLERVSQGDPEAIEALSRLADAPADYWQSEQISLARSRAVDLRAEAQRAGPMAKKIRPVRRDSELEFDEPEERVDELTLLVFADVRKAIADRQWTRAEEELIGIRASLEGSFPALTELEQELRLALAADVEQVLAAGQREQTLRGARAELAYLGVERWRFLREGAGSAVHLRWTELVIELGEPLELTQNFKSADSEHALGPDATDALAHVPGEAAPEVGEPQPSVTSAPSSAPARREPNTWDRRTGTLAIEARRLARDGKLTGAADRYQQAALQSEGAEQTRFSARARDARARGGLRLSLLQAFETTPFPGLSEISESGLILAGVGRDWADLEAPELLAMSSAAGIHSSLGLTLELLGLYDGSGQEEGGRRLHVAELEQLVSGGERNEWLALHQGQARIPVGGYLWEEERWKTATEADAAALGKRLGKLGKELERGDRERRDAAFTELQSLAVANLAAAESVPRHLAARLDSAKRALMGSKTMRKLQSMAGRRALLDTRRTALLELIEDDQRYFYPYLMPAVSAEEAATYRALQKQISGMLGVIERDWQEPSGNVSMSRRFRESLEDLRWCLLRMEAAGGLVRTPEGIPSWIEGVDPELEQVGLAHFAWSRDEAQALALGRLIQARNQELWAQLDGAGQLAEDELEQVQVTNRYRLMLGRQALGWSPILQDAARVHSDYMVATGHFGHEQEGALDRTPTERRYRRGYKHDGGENCHVGSHGPVGVHTAWLESSAHHRNLLSAHHHEIGVSKEGAYWTQVFGAATGWMDSLR
ncbi:MAG: hypothetical protein ACI9HE_002044 [Planctomycetota bacterium]